MGRLTQAEFRALAGGFTHFVETGTYHGETLANAAAYGGFESIQSIELDPDLYLRCVGRFHKRTTVRLYMGNSVELLPLIVAPTRPTMFWLDAHYTGPGTACADSQCPLLMELDNILALRWTAPILLLVDDAHAFDPDWWREHQERKQLGYRPMDWPTHLEIRNRLVTAGCSYVHNIDKDRIEARRPA